MQLTVHHLRWHNNKRALVVPKCSTLKHVIPSRMSIVITLVQLSEITKVTIILTKRWKRCSERTSWFAYDEPSGTDVSLMLEDITLLVKEPHDLSPKKRSRAHTRTETPTWPVSSSCSPRAEEEQRLTLTSTSAWASWTPPHYPTASACRYWSSA